jgi:peptidoglycan/xylan/chitin deacetylase (PgdA/CDA1 family)
LRAGGGRNRSDAFSADHRSGQIFARKKGFDRFVKRFPVLMYHAVSRVEGRLRPLGVSPELLSEQLSLLHQERYLLTGLTEALELVDRQPELKVIALTFDDAYVDFLESAVPVLATLKARATLYVPTAYVGSAASWLGPDASAMTQILDWHQLRECAESGSVEIGSHGHTHAQLDILQDDSLAAETSGSRALLEDELQVPVRSFCYPHGYHSRDVRAAVSAAGFESACEVGRRLRSDEHRLTISRLAVGPSDDPSKLLRNVVSGGPMLVPTVKRALQPAWRQVRRTGIARSRMAVA